ncbi:HK97 family phage major capsid protein [Enterococcus sp. AZ150]
MNPKLLKRMKAKNEKRLSELREKIESGEVREADIEGVQEEIDTLIDELQGINDELDKADPEPDPDPVVEPDNTEDRSEGAENTDTADNSDTNENRSGMITQEQRDGLLGNIRSGLQSRNAMNNKEREQKQRKAFADFIVGNISEHEARSLGIVAGNGSVTVPEVIASEVITYAQEENLLRKYGEVVRTAGDVKYPFLVKKAEANVNKKERTTEIPETDIEFDEITLDPAEFDALATVTKKLLKMSGVPIEDIVVEELKKAYVRKEINYMFNGDDAGNENPGALAKKAVKFTPEVTVDLTANDAG